MREIIILRNIGKKINSIQIKKYARDLFAYFSMKVKKIKGGKYGKIKK